jgi:hypothetical protein
MLTRRTFNLFGIFLLLLPKSAMAWSHGSGIVSGALTTDSGIILIDNSGNLLTVS